RRTDSEISRDPIAGRPGRAGAGSRRDWRSTTEIETGSRPSRGSGAGGGEVYPDEGSGTREGEAHAQRRAERDAVAREVRVTRDGELDVIAQHSHDLPGVEDPELPGGDVAGGEDGDPGDRRGRLHQRT